MLDAVNYVAVFIKRPAHYLSNGDLDAFLTIMTDIFRHPEDCIYMSGHIEDLKAVLLKMIYWQENLQHYVNGVCMLLSANNRNGTDNKLVF